MAKEDEEQVGKDDWKIRAIDGLKFIALTLHMLGDFFREIAALVFIFVPLELWDKQRVPGHSELIEYSVVGSLSFLTIGFIFEYFSAISNRFKKDLEANRGDK